MIKRALGMRRVFFAIFVRYARTLCSCVMFVRYTRAVSFGVMQGITCIYRL